MIASSVGTASRRAVPAQEEKLSVSMFTRWKEHSMKRVKTGIALLIVALLTVAALPAQSMAAAGATAVQDSTSALERGWRTGYSDGYQAGYGGSVEKAPR